MSDTTPSVQDDLAFMRALAGGGGTSFLRNFGEVYFATGVCYSLQIVGHGAQFAFGWFTESLAAAILGIGPTVVVVALIVWLNWRRRNSSAGGTVAKAVGAMFGAVGIANLVMVAVVGLQAWRMQSIQVWLIYPCIVMAFQGAAWMAAWTLRRRGWMGLVGVGWFATAIAMGAYIPNMPGYLAALLAGLVLCMALPGYAMMRTFRA
ncbi:MAG: hypothetical protein ACREE0_21420 [Phenylobacterium sp.]